MAHAPLQTVHLGGFDGIAAHPVCEIVPVGARMVGAVTGVDILGRDDTALTGPRAGVQVIDWVLDAEMRHGFDIATSTTETPLAAGGLAALTAGRGVRETTRITAGETGGPAAVRLWLALPRRTRDTAPSWERHDQAPTLQGRGIRARVLAGELAGVRSLLPVHTPLAVADLTLGSGGRAVLPLEDDFEHAVVPIAGTVRVGGTVVEPGAMLYLGCGRAQLALGGSAGAHALLLGGEPFGERVHRRLGILADAAGQTDAGSGPADV
ncbi:hypothetical protein G4X40_14685 [Rhodococcus sp. D2-41]|uniref:pirin family protein n=1 Tax=Speluncibacter jeojiensis TaxID=2710754 RepID=UPI002410947F|nr:pirin-like C-terminal cupin domain-containing protein [Rhodococcus sp. D2-41]MDG3011393.1 hypothetical protein [Rhodococcus sp. D2-41]